MITRWVCAVPWDITPREDMLTARAKLVPPPSLPPALVIPAQADLPPTPGPNSPSESGDRIKVYMAAPPRTPQPPATPTPPTTALANQPAGTQDLSTG